MRKLSELLPIARMYLSTPKGRGFRNGAHYTCIAATMAHNDGHMNRAEHDALVNRIEREIAPHETLIDYLKQDGALTHITAAWDRAFYVYRDAWLDAFQKKLEAEEASAVGQ